MVAMTLGKIFSEIISSLNELLLSAVSLRVLPYRHVVHRPGRHLACDYMESITLTKDNLENEHICCAISSNNKDCQVASKKQWLSKRFETAEQAQYVPAPFTTYSLFYKGEFLTHEILSEKRFEKILTEKACKEALRL